MRSRGEDVPAGGQSAGREDASRNAGAFWAGTRDAPFRRIAEEKIIERGNQL